MARELPIFPLPIVLFPGVTQPLHIFEPRYRTLLSDCLDGDRLFGIAYASKNDAPDPEPRPGDVGCIARILDATPLPDGRSDILTTGEERFVLLEWLATDRPYRTARVETFADEPEDAAEAAGLASDVRRDFLRVIEALDSVPPLHLPSEAEALSFSVAAALELEPAAKLALLSNRSTTGRLRRLAALLRPLAADAERRAGVRRTAKANGKGGPPSHVERAP